MNKTRLLAILGLVAIGSHAEATPFVPIDWQCRVKSGPLEGQRKHVGWIRDQNNNFIDDALEGPPRAESVQVIVQLSDCLSPNDLTKRFSVYGRVRRIGVLVAYVIIDNVSVKRLGDLAADPIVAAVEMPREVQVGLDTSTRVIRARASDTFSPETFEDAFGFTGDGVNIAVVDTGVDDDVHDAFAGKFVAGYDATASPPASGNPDDDWSSFHGTHVAGISLGLGAGAEGDCRPADDGSTPNDCQGVAPGAGLVDVKVFKPGVTTTDVTIIDGLEWIWMDGTADVVNMSLWVQETADGTETGPKVMNALVANGIDVAVISGNGGDDMLGRWASSSLAVTVGNANDNGTISQEMATINASSTMGPRANFREGFCLPGTPMEGQDCDVMDPDTDPCGGGPDSLVDCRLKGFAALKPDLAAPGTTIYSALGDTTDDYQPLSGTSMAAPHVAGAMALLKEMRPDIPPGALKDLLKRLAFETPDHGGATFPDIDTRYNSAWGYGLLDVYQSAKTLEFGITDLSFRSCQDPGCHPDYPTVRRCSLVGGAKSYANATDIMLSTDPPVQEEPNTITVVVENRGTATAEQVTVCVGVKELGAGLNEFYDVGCQVMGSILATEVVPFSFPWTPTKSNHQCIQATIDYGFDTEYCNNLTQRNTNPVPSSSPALARFRIENPLNEPATISLDPVLSNPNQWFVDFGQTTFELQPGDCAVLKEIQVVPFAPMPVGSTLTLDVGARVVSESHPDGFEASGVLFNFVTVPPGLDRAYSVNRHGPEGRLNLPLNLAGQPSSDPRRDVIEVLAVFNVPLEPKDGILSPNDVLIKSMNQNQVPAYTVEFTDGDTTGTELRIVFAKPLPDQDRYHFDFGSFVDVDGDPLTGDSTLELRVVAGDVNGSGTVTGTDVSFVRGRINQAVAFGDTSRADANRTGTITGTDISFVRARIGNSAP